MREEIVALRAWGLQAFEHAIEERLGQVRGVTVNLHSNLAPYDVIKSAALTEDNSAGGVDDPVTRYSRGIADKYGADACLLTTVDRFNRNAGFEHEIWISVRAWLWRGHRTTGEGGLRGPFYAVGRAVAGRQLFRKGFSKTDEQIAEDAAVQAVGTNHGHLGDGPGRSSWTFRGWMCCRQ